MKTLYIDRIASPIGAVIIVVDDGRLCALGFDDEQQLLLSLRRRYGAACFEESDDPHGISGHIRAYFDSNLHALDAIPVNTGGTAFQQSVWTALRAIPAGTTLSYGLLAAQIGKPAAVRAVGAANGANPISIVVPCHRLIGANGTLVKYGGGLERKRWLLRHEGVNI
ncbi:MAG TPA: methylated-DNA--[protein]-cysteine S-methyltransferase [Roseiflexaceae bacterium]|jgi:methylated-DNA-[protein]-cysteine S-methyltransferase|nr:methylated-DNA--[protein]-cysteine S-methyltransferase [Roseiflexaceae bacterium]